MRRPGLDKGRMKWSKRHYKRKLVVYLLIISLLMPLLVFTLPNDASAAQTLNFGRNDPINGKYYFPTPTLTGQKVAVDPNRTVQSWTADIAGKIYSGTAAEVRNGYIELPEISGVETFVFSRSKSNTVHRITRTMDGKRWTVAATDPDSGVYKSYTFYGDCVDANGISQCPGGYPSSIDASWLRDPSGRAVTYSKDVPKPIEDYYFNSDFTGQTLHSQYVYESYAEIFNAVVHQTNPNGSNLVVHDYGEGNPGKGMLRVALTLNGPASDIAKNIGTGGAYVLQYDFSTLAKWKAKTYAYWGNITINYEPLAQPDLVAADLKNTSTISIGSATNFACTFSNDGTAINQSFTLRVKSSSGAVLQSTNVSSMAAGASQTLNFSYTFSTAGSQTFTCEADPFGNITEASESNNTITQTFTASAPVGISGDFDITPSTINYRDSFTLHPKNISFTGGCTYSYHVFRLEGSGELPKVYGQTQDSTYNQNNYPYGIGIGSHSFSMKIIGSCGESEWIGPKTLTINGPTGNNPPYFKLGWFNDGDTTSTTPVTKVVQGKEMMVRVIETPNTNPPSPSDPDGDSFYLSAWDFNNNNWTKTLPGKYGFDNTYSWLSGIDMDTPGYHTIKATMTDQFGAQYTASAMIEVIPPNPIPVITGPTTVKEGRPLPSPFSSADSYSPVRRAIDHTRDEWTNKKATYTTPGTEIIQLHVYDSAGLKSLQPASHTLTVTPDQPPVAKLEIVPLGLRNQTYYVYNKSASNDGDTITGIEYKYRYDGNNNGFTDDVWVTLAGDMNRAALTPTKVGKYQLYIKATEDYGKTDDTLSDSLSTTVLDITNLNPSVSFQIEGKNTQPDLSPELVYSPSAVFGWNFTQVNSNNALPGKKISWTVGSTLSGGLGKKDEKLWPYYSSYSYGENIYRQTWFHPFSDSGFGNNGLSPYRPIKTPDPAYTQPLLVPIDTTSDGIDNPKWSTVSFGANGSSSQYKTTRNHFYFTMSPDVKTTNFYALNKNKISRYEFAITDQWGNYEHRLLDGSPYDYILEKKTTIDVSPVRFYGERIWDGTKHNVSFRKIGPTEYSDVWFLKTIAYHATDKTVYQLNQWNCGYCRMVDGSYEDFEFIEIRTYDLATGAFIRSSLEDNVFFTDFYNVHNKYSKGDNVAFVQDDWVPDGGSIKKFYEFNRDAKLVSINTIKQPPDIYKTDPSYYGDDYKCTAYSDNFYQGLEGELYRYESYYCYGRDKNKTSGSYEYYNANYDEVHLAKYNSDYTLAWRKKLAGKQTTPRESFSWKMFGGGFDGSVMVVNPFRNEVLVRTFMTSGFDTYTYYQAIDMTTGGVKYLDPTYSFDASNANFMIDWSGNYSPKNVGKSLTVDNKKVGFSNDPDEGRIYNWDGSLYSKYATGGLLWTSYMYAGQTARPFFHELIGDGLALTILNSTSYGNDESYDYNVWLNKGTPSKDPAAAPGYTLGQFLSPFALSNHEMNFSLSLDDADYDRDLAGFSFRAQDSTNRYSLETDGATLFLSKYVNGARYVLQQSNYPFADNVTVNFRIKTLGNRIEVFVNGVPYFDVTDGSWLSGKIGPFSNKSYVQFGSFSAKEVNPPETFWDSAYALWEDGTARAEVRYSDITFTDPENDPMSGTYRWKYSHIPKFINNQGLSTLHGQTFSGSQPYFDKVGVYDVLLSAEDDPHPSYRYPSNVFAAYRKASNEFGKRIIVHRKPIAQLTTYLNADHTIGYNDTSYDPDRWASAWNYSAPEDGKNYQTTRGIFNRKYYYITPSGLYIESQLTRPSEYGVYRVGLAVMDEYGAWSEWAVSTITVTNPFPPNTAPVATMIYPNGTQAAPTMETSMRPLLRWQQTDADAGTVFQKFQIQVTNEPNTAYILDSGVLGQWTSSTSGSWSPTSNLPTGQKLRVRVRVNDGAEWSAWSAQKWLFINNAPTATITYPTGSQASPTVVATKRPTITWNQSDSDPGTVFQYYQVEIINETNTWTVASSGQVWQGTSLTWNSWTPAADLPTGQKLKVRVRVYDGFAWSNWSNYTWLMVNRPPTADFTWLPNPVWEGDSISLTNKSTDPDGDTLTSSWTINGPGGYSKSYSTNDAAVAATDTQKRPGNWSVTLSVTDPYGESTSVTKTITVGDLGITGQVLHTADWENYRQAWNSKFPSKTRSTSTFWAGEALELLATVTDTSTSITKPQQVTAELIATGDTVVMSSGNLVNYNGQMLNTKFAKELSDGLYIMRFTVTWTNGHVEQHEVPFTIAGDINDVMVTQLRN